MSLIRLRNRPFPEMYQKRRLYYLLVLSHFLLAGAKIKLCMS